MNILEGFVAPQARIAFSQLNIDRFLSKLKIDFDSQCWEWQRAKDKDGYGKVRVNNVDIRAHRLAWQVFTGQLVPKGILVLHSCDNPPCCNFRHLRLGTFQDNMVDKLARGRGINPRGEDHPFAKLTNNNVMKIFERLANRESQQSIANYFNVSQSTIAEIARGDIWKHLRPPDFVHIPRRRKAPLILDDSIPVAQLPEQFQKVSIDADTAAIRAALEAGESLEWARLGERGSSMRIK